MIQYIYGKYGRERAALAATVISYRPKSAVRDVGKALGFDARAGRPAGEDAGLVGRRRRARALREAGLDPDSLPCGSCCELASELLGFPRHLSQHVGGFVISRGPLAELVPIENAAMAERTVIQWDKDDLEALGLLKVDVLALGMLTAIRRALRLAWASATARDVPQEDPAVYDDDPQADTVGVFQIESRAQMSMLPRLKPRNFYDLVIESRSCGPGPIQGGMVHPYLRRRHGLEPVDYPSEAVKRGARAHARRADLPGAGDAARDRRRRLHAGRGRPAAPRDGGVEAQGRAGAVREEAEGRHARERLQRRVRRAIFQQIQGFGEYGFPESHAASFALLAYVSSWLKCHQPAAFCAALLNSQPMGFYAPSQLVQDAQRHGVEVRPPDVTSSDWDCTLEGRRVAPRPAHGGRLAGGRGADASPQGRPLPRRVARSCELEPQGPALPRRGRRAAVAWPATARLAHWAAAGAGAPRAARCRRRRSGGRSSRRPREGEEIVADYASLGLTLGRHPLALLRGASEEAAA